MILVDTSAWIEFFRGRDPVAGAVDDALASNEAALCGPVEAELRRGLLNERERATVLPLLDACHLLAQPGQLRQRRAISALPYAGAELRRRPSTC